MKMKRLICAVLALALCCALCLSAVAEEGLSPLAEQGAALLLKTGNVTIRGHAEFDLDGERFKTADAVYIQEGSNSLWQLDLVTPRDDQPDKESGFTVIANGMMFYTMEKLRPGVYRSGSDIAQYAILRPSAEAEALGSLAGSLAGAAESQLAPGALTVTREEGGETEYALEIKEDEVPFLVNAALNVYTEFAVHRFMGLDYDMIGTESQWQREDYDTTTLWILYGTRAFTLADSSVKIKTDAAGHIAAANGTVRARLDLGEQEKHLLEIRFDVTVSDYGTSQVGTFNPANYGVSPAEEGYFYTDAWAGYGEQESWDDTVPEAPAETDPDTASRLADRAAEVIAACGSAGADLSYWSAERVDNYYSIRFLDSRNEETTFQVTLTEDGQVVYLYDFRSTFYGQELDYREPKDFALTAEQQEKLNAVLENAWPGITERCVSWNPVEESSAGGETFIVLESADANGEISGIYITLRLTPEFQVVQMSLLAALY